MVCKSDFLQDYKVITSRVQINTYGGKTTQSFTNKLYTSNTSIWITDASMTLHLSNVQSSINAMTGKSSTNATVSRATHFSERLDYYSPLAC